MQNTSIEQELVYVWIKVERSKVFFIFGSNNFFPSFGSLKFVKNTICVTYRRHMFCEKLLKTLPKN